MTELVERENPLKLIGQLEEVEAATLTSLHLPDDMTFGQWQAMGYMLGTIRDRIKWWIGDWLIFGDSRYGEEHAQALDALSLDPAVITRYRYVAAMVPPKRRRERLSWTHHQEVAQLSPREQEKMLDRCEQESLSTRQLREAKKKLGDEPEREQPQWTKDDVLEDLRSAAKMVCSRAIREGALWHVPNEQMARLRAAVGMEAE